ncbi:MAG: site-specific integrase, partial [Neisseria sp.]|nr:site-specific integrase [Neisseria sp.]
IERQNKIAIMLIMLVFVRNNELRGGQWEEVDFKNKRWIIPAERMKHEKMKPKPALCVPLSDWVIELLQELHTLTGHSRFMFPSRTNVNRHISENTLGKIINEKLGYKGKATPHGFRAVASSLLYENNFNGGAIETQLAHVEENKIKDSYAYQADYMPQRIEFMQWYSDYLRERYNQALQMIQDDKTD